MSTLDERGQVMARLWTELRSELVADGRLDERRVAAARAQLLARLRAHEITEAGEARRAVRAVRRVAGTKLGQTNDATSSKSLAELAAQVLQDPQASKIQKSLATSALSQRDASCETAAEAERRAAMVLRGKRYAEVTRRLAVLVMANAKTKAREGC